MKTILFKGQTLILHPKKGIFWKEQQTLLLADLHLGKAAHFRKQGLAAPAAILHQNFNNFRQLLKDFTPRRVLFLGDLFHSSLNQVWEKFAAFLEEYPNISFELVKGNHDILPEAIYEASVMKIHQPPLIVEPFIFSHYPLKQNTFTQYNFYGHLHPGVVLEGWGKQVMKLPCFFFEETQAVLPAFGAFTGLAIMQPKIVDRVFVVTDKEVLEM